MNRELEENLNNSYLVKRRLSTLRKLPGDACYILDVERFSVRMYTNAEFSNPPNRELPLLNYKTVTVEVWEDMGPDTSSIYTGGIIHMRREINFSTDYRFKNFVEEKTTNQEWRATRSRAEMSIVTLCDFIKYVDRIVELTAFH